MTKTCQTCSGPITNLRRTVTCSNDCALARVSQKTQAWWAKSDKNKRLKLRFQIFERDGFACVYCGRRAPEATLEIDHIKPKSKGGSNHPENYATACRECNVGKGDAILNG